MDKYESTADPDLVDLGEAMSRLAVAETVEGTVAWLQEHAPEDLESKVVDLALLPHSPAANFAVLSCQIASL